MSLFLKKFLREGRGIFLRETRPWIYLGAFGKHPGWDDHIDDLGLETESLLLAKQILYVDGIGGQINTGEWEKLGESQSVAGFKHVFVWKRGDVFILGKIFSSRDGKNRTKYPMILGAQCLATPFEWALRHVLPILDRLEAQCRNAPTADEVRSVLRFSHDEMKRVVAAIDDKAATEARPPEFSRFVERLAEGTQNDGLYRIVYYVHTQMARYLAGARNDDGAELRASQIRLPAAADLPAETLSFWSLFLESQFGGEVPILLTLPVGESWLDATVGEPATREFYGLRASPEVLTVASEIPYTITDDFRQTHKELIQAMLEGRTGHALPGDKSAKAKKWFA